MLHFAALQLHLKIKTHYEYHVLTVLNTLFLVLWYIMSAEAHRSYLIDTQETHYDDPVRLVSVVSC